MASNILPHQQPIIDAYCWPLSALPGDTIKFHVSSPNRPNARVSYTIIQRTRVPTLDGVIVGSGSIESPVPAYPVPEDAPTHGCRWPSALSLVVDKSLISSLYEVRFHFTDGSPASPHSTCFFIVRPSANTLKPTRILLAIATNTYAAYNDWPAKQGLNMYTGATQSSFLRPWVPGLVYKPPGGPGRRVALEDNTGKDVEMRNHVKYTKSNGLTSWAGSGGFPNYEETFAVWLAQNNFDVEYCTNADLEDPSVLDGKNLYLSVGHDEYWSSKMRDSVEGFVAKGGNAVFFSGNVSYWQVRAEGEVVDGIGGTVMVGYKQQVEKDPYFKDPSKHHLLTSIWSDYLIQRPENHMTGVSFVRGGYSRIRRRVPRGSAGYRIYRPEHWIFEGTKFEYGDELGADVSIVGYECDGLAMKIGKDGRPEPTFVDGTPSTFQILGLAPASPFTHATAARPTTIGTRDEVQHNAWRTGIPEEELMYNHAVLGTWTNKSGGTVVTAGCTDWACGVGRDEMVDVVTRNIVGRLSKGLKGGL